MLGEKKLLIEIRRMNRVDVDYVIQLASITTQLQTYTNSQQFWSKEILLKWIASQNDLLLVVKINKKFAGFVITTYNHYSRDGYINSIVIDKKYRDMGIGTILLRKILRELKNDGCNNVFCVVKSTNDGALDFFKNYGFSVGVIDFKYVARSL